MQEVKGNTCKAVLTFLIVVFNNLKKNLTKKLPQNLHATKTWPVDLL